MIATTFATGISPELQYIVIDDRIVQFEICHQCMPLHFGHQQPVSGFSAFKISKSDMRLALSFGPMGFQSQSP